DGVVEPTGHAHEHELVHRGGHHESAVLVAVGGEVAAAASQGEAHRRARDDHRVLRKCRSRSAQPAGEPISKNLSWTTRARKLRPAASPACTRSRPNGTPSGRPSMPSRRKAVAP